RIVETRRNAALLIALTALVASGGCASGPRSVNEMLRSSECFAWTTDSDPIQVRAIGGLAYDARKGSGSPIATWESKTSVVSVGRASTRIADFRGPDRLSFKPLLGASGPTARLLKNRQVEISELDVGNIEWSPSCSGPDAALAVAGVFFLRTLREG